MVFDEFFHAERVLARSQLPRHLLGSGFCSYNLDTAEEILRTLNAVLSTRSLNMSLNDADQLFGEGETIAFSGALLHAEPEDVHAWPSETVGLEAQSKRFHGNGHCVQYLRLLGCFKIFHSGVIGGL